MVNANIFKALNFAKRAHKGQKRDDGRDYFQAHIIPVSSLIRRYYEDEDVIIAAILHDTIEDCGVTYEELKIMFNENVANMVKMLTKSESNTFPFLKFENNEYDYYVRCAMNIKHADIFLNCADFNTWPEERIVKYLNDKKSWNV